MSEELDIYNDQYRQETILIKANGKNKAALRLRYKQYRIHEQDLVNYIKRKTFEQAGRKAALEDMGREIGEED